MINEKEYAKVIAVNLRNIMYERHLTQADLAAFYGGIYCRQRGSNPHKVGVYMYV